MSKQRIILIMTVGIIFVLSAGQALAGSFVIGARFGNSHIIAGNAGSGFWRRPMPRWRAPVIRPYRSSLFGRPIRSRFSRIYPRRRDVVMVRPRPIFRTIHRPVVVERANVIVWITNSNGSQTSVRLTRSGPGFKGPRGEWYRHMPAERQLRVIYGF